PFPVEFRIMGPDPAELYRISEQALALMSSVPDVRQANRDWGNRAPVLRFVPDQDRLNLIGLSPAEAAQQMQLLLTGLTVTQVRENIRNVPVVARSAGDSRLDPSRLADFSLMSRSGRQVPLDQLGHSEIRFEEPILKRRDRTPVITVRADINDATQPPEVSQQVMQALQPLIASLPVGYRIEMGGNIEESLKANVALVKIFPLMIAAMLIVIILQVRSLSTMTMVMMTAPLGLAGVVPTLILFNQPFGFNAILGLIGLAGILMRNTLILTEQIKENKAAGLDDYHAVIEATVQRTRPVILTALAAVLAFIPLTHSVFWGSMAYTLIGGTAVGTALILLFLPALYAAWFRIKPMADEAHAEAAGAPAPHPAMAAE
ncbi:efflux RND transporter permease subunit, partial [Methylobacillus flagellatus]|uniref:efflux RND transporter permease subunit n=1 Tax=Methylobacillus flagellatus TaxID=405 RepID=UPI00285415B1